MSVDFESTPTEDPARRDSACVCVEGRTDSSEPEVTNPHGFSLTAYDFMCAE
jgi:hypothetical protein